MEKKYTTVTESGILFNVRKEFSMDENRKIYEDAKYSLNWKNLLTALIIIFIICQIPDLYIVLIDNIDLNSYIVNSAMVKDEEKIEETLNEPIQEKCIKKCLKKNELVQLSKQELQCLINIIYAFNGQYFDENSSLYEYFMGFEWYQNIPKRRVAYEDLDNVQRENVDLIVKVMREKGYRE